MKRMVWIYLIGVTLVLGVVLALVQHFREYETVTNSTCLYASVAGIDDDKIVLESHAYEDMIEQSDIIISVSVEDERTKKNNAILTKVLVSEIYKGSLSDDYIYIYEPVDIIRAQDSHSIYGTSSAYTLMQTHETYLLFLKFNKMPDGYRYTQLEQKSYLLAHQVLGKYPLSQELTFSDIETPVEFSEVKDLSLLSQDPELIATYKDCYNKAMRSYAQK
jgi:hypothetical protein